MMEEIHTITAGYRERMRRIALFDPLNELARKSTKDLGGKQVDMHGLGMLTLLFFFERRLTREYKTGIKALTSFLLEMTQGVYHIEPQHMEKNARELIQVFRPSTGKKRAYPFFNWETGENEKIEYSILKDNGFDARTQTQYYTLDEDGLELLFATKEFYGEFQISINQLLLKQQIKKGEFHSALRQIREMEIDVDVLREKMEKMDLEIKRSIVSEETFERYKKLLEDTHQRFERENDEFKALTRFIEETRDTLHTDDIKKQEKRSYQQMIQIAKELEAVHYEHARLLEMTFELRTTALATAQESLYYTGIQMFNFDQDIVTAMLAGPMHPNKMRAMAHPFLRVEENPIWSPLTVFQEQNIMEERKTKEVETFQEASDEGEDIRYQQWMAEKYTHIMQVFLTDYEAGQANTLREWMTHLQETNNEMIHQAYFYSFCLLMHQLSPLKHEQVRESEQLTILQGVTEKLGKNTLHIQEKNDIIHMAARYSIQNMTLKLEEDEDELSGR